MKKQRPLDGLLLKPKQHRTMAEVATGRLHDAIISGVIPQGAQLRLGELSEQLEMSPIPVREALSRLEALGLVETFPHRGTFVRRMSREDFDDTMELRQLLETACIDRAAARFTDEDGRRAEKALNKYLALFEADMVVEAREAHREFHFALYQAAQSRWMLRAIDPVWKNSERYRFAANVQTSRNLDVDEHRVILEMCRRREPKLAAQALRAHLSQAAARMEANLGEYLKPEGDSGEVQADD